MKIIRGDSIDGIATESEWVAVRSFVFAMLFCVFVSCCQGERNLENTFDSNPILGRSVRQIRTLANESNESIESIHRQNLGRSTRRMFQLASKINPALARTN